jgi:hypothetical protein
MEGEVGFDKSVTPYGTYVDWPVGGERSWHATSAVNKFCHDVTGL